MFQNIIFTDKNKQESISVRSLPPACRLYPVVSQVPCIGGGVSTLPWTYPLPGRDLVPGIPTPRMDMEKEIPSPVDKQIPVEQECITVGCVLPASVTVSPACVLPSCYASVTVSHACTLPSCYEHPLPPAMHAPPPHMHESQMITVLGYTHTERQQQRQRQRPMLFIN